MQTNGAKYEFAEQSTWSPHTLGGVNTMLTMGPIA
jgi:hypothetical protein